MIGFKHLSRDVDEEIVSGVVCKESVRNVVVDLLLRFGELDKENSI